MCCMQEVQDPESAELGLTLYQLATTYYAHDMLIDAGTVLQRATQLMRAHYPEEHDLVGGCCCISIAYRQSPCRQWGA
jgi:hypothetical protein